MGTAAQPAVRVGQDFARALVDLLVPTDPDGARPAVVKIGEIQHAVRSCPRSCRCAGSCLAFLAAPARASTAFERAVEQWYDEQMAKMAGWYKRWARVVLGSSASSSAVAVNIDTVQVGHSLYVDAPLQQAVVATANAGTLCQGESPTRAGGTAA